jgi:photosystem II stability/assembly factor-like uncharacterized protein
VATIAFVLVIGAVLFINALPKGGQTAWARFDTADVHSLAFVGGDPEHLLFGHHGGLLESRDGGRSWSALPVRDDAMSMAPADDGSIVIAGHEVFTASRDGGFTWASIPADLPSLDIHGFTRDPADPARMWVYLATGGLWETTDFGAHWTEVRADNVIFPLAVREGSTSRLLGVDANGLVTSTDGGRTWTTLGTPPLPDDRSRRHARRADCLRRRARRPVPERRRRTDVVADRLPRVRLRGRDDCGRADSRAGQP